MGIVVVEGVLALRKLLVAASASDVAALSASMGVASASATAAFAPYLWRGHDYLAKMVHDCDFVVEIPNATALLDLPATHLALNPLFAQTPLTLAPRAPAMPPIAEFLINM